MLVEQHQRNARDPQIAIDDQGRAIAVWTQDTGAWDTVWANRFSPDHGWDKATPITAAPGYAAVPQIAANTNGVAVAVWEQFDGATHTVWANHFAPNVGWSGAVKVATPPGHPRAPHVAIDDEAHGLVVWEQIDVTSTTVWESRYVPDAGWTPATLIGPTSGYGHSPRIAAGPSGDAVAVWQQFDGVTDTIWANRYSARIGWEQPTRIQSQTTERAEAPRVAMAPNGEAVVVWEQFGPLRSVIWANQFTPERGWALATQVSTGPGYARSPEIAIDGTGRAIAIWQQIDRWRDDITVSHYTPHVGWDLWRFIEATPGRSGPPHIAMNHNGNALAIWTRTDGLRGGIWTNTYDPGNGWDTTDTRTSNATPNTRLGE